MKKLIKALHYEKTKKILEKDCEYQRGYIQALTDVKNNNLHYGTKVCNKITDCGYTAREVSTTLKVDISKINQICYDGILNKTLLARKIAKLLDIDVAEIMER